MLSKEGLYLDSDNIHIEYYNDKTVLKNRVILRINMQYYHMEYS